MDLVTSETITELAAAMVQVQIALKPAIKDSTNPHFGSKYADLAAVWEAARPALTAHGFSVIQSPDRRDGEVGVTTLLLHASGQWVRGRVSARPQKDDPQGVGSCISYLRRYSLAAMTGVVSEDDDAEAAHGRDAKGKPAAMQQPAGGAAGRGGDTVRARRPAPRPAAGNPSPSSVGGTPPDEEPMTPATKAALIDAGKALKADGGDPKTVMWVKTGKASVDELTEQEAHDTFHALQAKRVELQKGKEQAA